MTVHNLPDRGISRSIPGQPAPKAPAPMPADALGVAVSAVKALSASISADDYAAPLRPPPIKAAIWDVDMCGPLLTTVRPDLTRRQRSYISIHWTWAVLWGTSDWYEVGWHPDEGYWALRAPYGDLLWGAVNPGKAPPQPARRR